MRIIRVECTPFKLPIRRDTGWASSTVSIGRFVLIRVKTDEGLIGLGDAEDLVINGVVAERLFVPPETKPA